MVITIGSTISDAFLQSNAILVAKADQIAFGFKNFNIVSSL